MRNRSHTGFGVACVVLACVVGAAVPNGTQAQRPAERQTPESVVVSTDEVLLDVVVRDKRGRLVNDLAASDFDVYEDGVRQEVNSFRLVTPAGAAASAAGGST